MSSGGDSARGLGALRGLPAEVVCVGSPGLGARGSDQGDTEVSDFRRPGGGRDLGAVVTPGEGTWGGDLEAAPPPFPRWGRHEAAGSWIVPSDGAQGPEEAT